MQLIDLIKNLENKQKIMIGALVAVVAITGFVLYNYYFGKKPAIPPSTLATSISPAAGIRLDMGILKSPIFQNLKKIGQYPIESKEEEFGRPNPFIPF